MAVKDDLARLGGAWLGDFSQGKFRKNVVVQGIDLTGGYCSGVTLDWARRVLQSQAKPRDQTYLTYSGPKYQKGNPRTTAAVRRMAKAYDGHAPTYVGGLTIKAAVVEALQRLAALGAPADEEVVVDAATARQLIPRFFKVNSWPFAEFDLATNPAGKVHRDDLKQVIDFLVARKDEQLSLRSADGRHWESYATELDQVLATVREERGGQGLPKKLFSNLRVINSNASKPYPEGGAQWVQPLFNDGFRPSGCTIVSVAQPGGDAHAVAVHHNEADPFLFFDPNYGAFRFNAKGVRDCFAHLFWKAAFADPDAPVDGDKAVYLRRRKHTDLAEGEWSKMGYTTFALK